MRLLNFTHSDGRPLGVQPAAILTIETAQAATKEKFPGSETFIRFLMGQRAVVARLRNTPARVLERLRKVDARAWLSAELAEGGEFHVRPEIVNGIEGAEPVDGSKVATLIHFSFGGAVVEPYGVTDDAGELLEALNEAAGSAGAPVPAMANLDEDFAPPAREGEVMASDAPTPPTRPVGPRGGRRH